MPVVVKGLVELKRALKEYAPDLKKQLDKRTREALRSITSDVKSHVKGDITGLSSLSKASVRKETFPKWSESEVKKGITYSIGKSKANREGFSAMYSVLNKSAVGAIADTAGRANPHGRPTTHEVTIDKRFSKKKIQVHTTKDSQSNNPHAGEHFIEALNRGLGDLENVRGNKSGRKHTGRLIFAGVERNRGKAKDAILKAIEDARRDFQSRLGR